MLKSQAARYLAVRRVAQENQGKKAAGVDGVSMRRPHSVETVWSFPSAAFRHASAVASPRPREIKF